MYFFKYVFVEHCICLAGAHTGAPLHKWSLEFFRKEKTPKAKLATT